MARPDAVNTGQEQDRSSAPLQDFNGVASQRYPTGIQPGDVTPPSAGNGIGAGPMEKGMPEFVTTSYVLDSLNTALQQVMAVPKQDADQSNATYGETKQTFFELQKRLPDGSTRKATREEMASADMNNKLEQSAARIAKMTLEQKRDWAHQQRQQGNQLYRDGQYKEAMDIYLTCLVARGEQKTKPNENDNDETHGGSDRVAITSDKGGLEEQDEWLLLPVMNNLAQCTLQLGWYHKTEQFCTMAMEHLGTEFYRGGPSVAKLYFKRGKARRLRGMFPQAKADLNQALWHLDVTTSDEKEEKRNEEQSPERRAIERELQLLAKNSKEGEKNEKRQQRAMQKVLGGAPSLASATNQQQQTDDDDDDGTDKHASSKTTQSSTNIGRHYEQGLSVPLYQDKQQRTHSTIRKRPEGPPPYPRISGPPLNLSYWQMYRLIMAKVAQRLLDIIGDGEKEENGRVGDEEEEEEDDDEHHLKAD